MWKTEVAPIKCVVKKFVVKATFLRESAIIVECIILEYFRMGMYALTADSLTTHFIGGSSYTHVLILLCAFVPHIGMTHSISKILSCSLVSQDGYT